MIRTLTLAATAALFAGVALAHTGALPHAHPHGALVELTLGLVLAALMGGVAYGLWRARETRDAPPPREVRVEREADDAASRREPRQ